MTLNSFSLVMAYALFVSVLQQSVDALLLQVWDVIAEQEAFDMIKNDTDPTIMSKRILVQAIKVFLSCHVYLTN